jgi:XTP/dITP diphosphohydrolase
VVRRGTPDVTFLSSNPNKAREVRATLGSLGITSRWKRQSLTEVQADSLQEVVQAKLRSIPRISGTILVEDSGLFIRSLRGFPGVYSAPTFRELGVEGILRLLNDGEDRSAVFRTVAGVRTGRRRALFVGEVKGQISDRPRGSRGFGYDPIFIPNGSALTYAEMTLAEKNRWSHRGKALSRVARFLRSGR